MSSTGLSTKISHNYNTHDNITYLEYGDIKDHGPASSQSYNVQEAVTKTLMMIQSAIQTLIVINIRLTDIISTSSNAAKS